MEPKLPVRANSASRDILFLVVEELHGILQAVARIQVALDGSERSHSRSY